jgi:Protein of unknown function (DUF2637)
MRANHISAGSPAGSDQKTEAERAVRWLTVAAVAMVAAVLSYRHQYELAVTHGGSVLTARLVPLSIDGLLLAGSLAILDAARRDRGQAWAARLTVGLGVAMTLWANTVHGIAYGPVGVVVSGWPPVALIAAIEVLARMVRPAAAVPDALAAEAARKAASEARPKPVRKSALRGPDAATEAVRRALAGGQPVPSARSIARTHHIGRDRGSQVRAAALVRVQRAPPRGGDARALIDGWSAPTGYSWWGRFRERAHAWHDLG